MSDSSSTLAQMLFKGKPELNFAHVVGELDTALARYPASRRSLGWDCDDLAIFDLDGARIVLAYCDDLDGPHSACLTVAVGHGPLNNGASSLAKHRAAFCRKITDRLALRHRPDTVLWQEVDAPVTADLINSLVDHLPEHDLHAPVEEETAVDRLLARMSVELNSRDTPPAMNFARPDPAGDMGLSQMALEPAPVANDVPDLPRLSDPELSAVRAALYPDAKDGPVPDQSAQMRLAIHAMNATMIVVFMPVGLAAMVSGLRKGENLRFSAQLMALTGLFGAIWHSPMGDRMLGMI